MELIAKEVWVCVTEGGKTRAFLDIREADSQKTTEMVKNYWALVIGEKVWLLSDKEPVKLAS